MVKVVGGVDTTALFYVEGFFVVMTISRIMWK